MHRAKVDSLSGKGVFVLTAVVLSNFACIAAVVWPWQGCRQKSCFVSRNCCFWRIVLLDCCVCVAYMSRKGGSAIVCSLEQLWLVLCEPKLLLAENQ